MSLSRQQYIDLITNDLLPDNASQLISPQDLRTSLILLVDSIENFLIDDLLNTSNVGAINLRSTYLGSGALDKRLLPGRYNEDNTALGYYSMGGNYNGITNTAVGSYSLGCNLYGSNNVAVGFNTLAGNLNGSGNVAVGNHALQSNKYGDFNIAIGHAAGYYYGDNYNYKLIIAAHEVDPGDLCDISVASGKAPLVYGDLKDYRFGIGVKSLHEYGTLQVSGDITPSQNKKFGLGNPLYAWGSAYITSGIAYSNSGDLVLSRYNELAPFVHTPVAAFTSQGNIGLGTSAPSGSQGLVTVAGHIVPATDNIYRLGHPNLKWDGVFNDIIVSGRATMNNFTYVHITSNLYEQKTLHLATSGECYGDIFGSAVCGYLTDEALDGAGFEIHSSGTSYRRDYRFIYKFPDQSLNCLELDNSYSRSRWYTNISLEVEDGKHLKTQRILSKDRLSFVSESGCYGLFVRPRTLTLNQGNKVAFCQESDLSNTRGDFNLIYTSGFSVSFASKASGIKPTLELVSRLNNTPRGFYFQYDDSLDTIDNLTISAIGSNNSITLNRLTGSGVFGVTNRAGNIYPATIFNVQSSGIADVRVSSSGLNRSSIELLVNGNEKASGIEFLYTPIAGLVPLLDLEGDLTSDNASQTVFDVSLLLPSGGSYSDLGAISIANNGYVGIGRTKYNRNRVFQPNAPLTISNITKSSGTISMREQAVKPDFTADFGKIYIKPYIFGPQTQSLFFIDDVGNEFNVNPSKFDTNGGLIFNDSNGNTYGGLNCPAARPTASTYRNTVYGNSGLYSISTGSDNVIVGAYCANKITTGSKNIVIGSESLDNLSSNNSSSANILFGYRNAYQSTTINNAIAIGTGLNPPSYGLLVGYANAPLISGSLGGASRSFTLKNASFAIDAIYDEQTFSIQNIQENSTHVAVIKLKDNNTSNYSPNFASLRFTDQNDVNKTLMDFVYNANPVNITPAFSVASPARPYVSVSGDLRVLGAIRFADGSSIDDGNLDVALNFINLPNAFDTPNTITVSNSYLAMSVPSGAGNYVGRVSIGEFSSYIGSGFARVVDNCNHIWTNVENLIDVNNNANSIFAGCDVAVGATGWKNTVMIGTEAGAYSTTPNVGLDTDTAGVFIGYKAGYNADFTANSIYIGTNAGNNSFASNRSIFIGSNAGKSSYSANSIGIGYHALRGDDGPQVQGQNNIEIVTGLLDDQRLFYTSGNLSDRINIQNTIAGNTRNKRISIGHATLNPTAILTVRKHTLVEGHDDTEYVQDWWCNGNRVAAVDCNGNFLTGTTVNPSGARTVMEGRMNNALAAPLSPATPTSGLFTIKSDAWANMGTEYVVNKDPSLSIPSGAFIVVNRVNGTYRPVWVSCSGVAA